MDVPGLIKIKGCFKVEEGTHDFIFIFSIHYYSVYYLNVLFYLLKVLTKLNVEIK